MSRRDRATLDGQYDKMAAVIDVTVVLTEGSFASTAVAPIEVLHSAGLLWNTLRGDAPEPRFNVRVASVDGQPVQSACAVGLVPQHALDDIARQDIVIVAASGLDLDAQMRRHAPLLPWLRARHAEGAIVASICSGAAFLAEAGLLDGRRATTHWATAEMLRQRYPAVRWEPDSFVTEDGRVLCSGGVYAAIDLSLHLVERFCGHEIAVRCAKSLLVGMPRARQSGYAVLTIARPHDDARIREAEEWLQARFDTDVSLDALAADLGMATRTFIRRFKAATGRQPLTYLQVLRVEAAKEMLEQGASSVQAVCDQIGYEDIAFFRTVFRRHTGMTPAEYRRAFAGLSVPRRRVEGASQG